MESEWMLQVTDLNKTVDREEILKKLTFSFAKKGVHGILAPRGAGKTTLLDILAGWDGDFEGAICLQELSLEFDELRRKRLIGYVPARSALDPDMTVGETMRLVGRAKRVSKEKLEMQIKEALELVGLSELSRRLVSNLSEGQKKFLSVAAALLGNPKLLLLDEPTRGISVEERDQMWSLIRLLGTFKTVVLSTEGYHEARELCMDVVLMADGRALASGSFEQLEETLASNQNGNDMTLESLYYSLSNTEVRE